MGTNLPALAGGWLPQVREQPLFPAEQLYQPQLPTPLPCCPSHQAAPPRLHDPHPAVDLRPVLQGEAQARPSALPLPFVTHGGVATASSCSQSSSPLGAPYGSLQRHFKVSREFDDAH